MGTPPVRLSTSYPAGGPERDRFILERRPPRPARDPWRYQDLVLEDERSAEGTIARTATVFLTGRECPWRCVMCDLWRYTTETDTPPGAIATQVAAARSRLRSETPAVTHLKLYNAGSFFDARAVPEDDYGAVATEVAGLATVVVESHPALVGARVDRFLDALDVRPAAGARPTHLEVAMGLETVHPNALERLHKRMTVGQFEGAARSLRARGVSVRAFLLIAPPFVPRDEQDDWLRRSVDTAVACGASAITLIPARGGNGAMEALSAEGAFEPPRLEAIERSIEATLPRGGEARIFVDLWDLERFADCPVCFSARRDRLHTMNLEQRTLPPVVCACEG